MALRRASPWSSSLPAKTSRASGISRASGAKAAMVSAFIFVGWIRPTLAMIRASGGMPKRARIALRCSGEGSRAVAPNATTDVLPRWSGNRLRTCSTHQGECTITAVACSKIRPLR